MVAFGGPGRWLRHRWGQPLGRWTLLGAAAGVLAAVVGLTWLCWPEPEEQPRARQYLEFTACLLTDEQGLTGSDAAPVWAGMQEASLATRAKVQYLSVLGPQTAENAATFLASQAQGHCDLVFATGPVQAAAVRSSAARFAGVHFYLKDDQPAAANVSQIAGATADEVRGSVSDVVTKAVRASGED